MGKANIRDSLVPIVQDLERQYPNRFISRVHVVNRVAQALGVTGQAVRKHLTDLCSDGELLEIHPDRDWRVRLPGADHLKPLYAWPDGDAYQLRPQRPVSRGVSQLTFIATPRGLTRRRIVLRSQYEDPLDRPVHADVFVDAMREVTCDPLLGDQEALIVLRWMPDLSLHEKAEALRDQGDSELADLIDPLVWDGRKYRRKADGEAVPSGVLSTWRRRNA